MPRRSDHWPLPERTELEPVLTEVVDAAIAISSADFGNIQLLDPETSHLEIAAQRGFPQWWLDFWASVDAGRGACGAALQSGERVIIEDVEESPVFRGTTALETLRRVGVRAVQSTPVVTRCGTPLGMFSTHYASPPRLDEGALRLLDLLARQAADTLERARSDRLLRESEQRYASIFTASPVPMALTRMPAAAIVAVNDAFLQLFERARHELLGAALVDAALFAPDGRERVRAALDEERAGARELECAGVTRSGDRRTLSLDLDPVRIGGERHVLTTVRDLTEQRRLEEQSRHAQKMEAIGTLAAGIAHDFGNLLTGLVGCAEIASSKLDPESPAAPYVRELSDAAQRGSRLTKRLVTFSRKETSALEALDLDAVVRNDEELLRRLIGENVSLRVETASAGSSILAAAGRIEQILVNLVVNARDAMPDGGEITVRTGEVHLDERSAERQGLTGPGRYATLSVVDTGHGMDAATRSRAFEPFFTRKAPGRGSGLGLSTVYGIVQQLEGSVRLETAPGRGTEFTLYFPRARDVDVGGGAEPTEPAPRAATSDRRLLS